MPQAPPVKRVKTGDEVDDDNKKRLIVILENCSLESAKVRNSTPLQWNFCVHFHCIFEYISANLQPVLSFNFLPTQLSSGRTNLNHIFFRRSHSWLWFLEIYALVIFKISFRLLYFPIYSPSPWPCISASIRSFHCTANILGYIATILCFVPAILLFMAILHMIAIVLTAFQMALYFTLSVLWQVLAITHFFSCFTAIKCFPPDLTKLT